MNALAQIIGWAFLIAAVIGAVVPGLNFHVGFMDDEAAIEWHQKTAEKVKQRWEKKHGKKWEAA